jgi:glycosyltransferase involved in cell wall biosynthesis
VKILQLAKFYPPFFGGIELVEKMLTKAHQECGDQVNIIAFKQFAISCPSVGEFGEDIRWLNLDCKISSAPFNFQLLLNFKKIIKEMGPERIYIHLPNPMMHELIRMNYVFLKKMDIEIVAIYHSDIVNQKILNWFYDPYFKLTSKIYNKIIVSSDNLWRSSKTLRALPIEKKRVIPFCSEGKLVFKKRENFNFKILAIGRLVPYKGFDFLIKSLNDSKYEVHIIGDGPERLKLQSIASQNITFHLKVSEEKKQSLLNECSLLAVTSINNSEAYGMIIVEAFENGMPVIASNLETGVSFLVQNEFNGFLFDTLSVTSFKNKLDSMSHDEKFVNYSKNAREFYLQHLSFTAFKERIKNL